MSCLVSLCRADNLSMLPSDSQSWAKEKSVRERNSSLKSWIATAAGKCLSVLASASHHLATDSFAHFIAHDDRRRRRRQREFSHSHAYTFSTLWIWRLIGNEQCRAASTENRYSHERGSCTMLRQHENKIAIARKRRTQTPLLYSTAIQNVSKPIWHLSHTLFSL